MIVRPGRGLAARPGVSLTVRVGSRPGLCAEIDVRAAGCERSPPSAQSRGFPATRTAARASAAPRQRASATRTAEPVWNGPAGNVAGVKLSRVPSSVAFAACATSLVTLLAACGSDAETTSAGAPSVTDVATSSVTAPAAGCPTAAPATEWSPDILGDGFTCTTIDLGADPDGEAPIVATLVRHRQRWLPCPAKCRKAMK